MQNGTNRGMRTRRHGLALGPFSSRSEWSERKLSRPTAAMAGRSRPICENASNHDPTAKLTQHIDFVRKDEILAGSFFARNVTLSRQGD